MMLTNLASIARAAGLKVIEVDGWKTRQTPDGYKQIAVDTIVCHHTANGGAPGNAPSLDVVTHGRAGLPGPLSHFVLAKDGTVYVVAAGHCNHAGVSLKTTYENGYSIGIEAEADGEPGHPGDWPAVQITAYRRLCAALVDAFDLSVADVRGHKETCSPRGRKSDPSFDMDDHRAGVAAVNLKTPMQEDTDMELTDKIKLATQAQVDAMNSNVAAGGTKYKLGDEFDVERFIVWGGPGAERLYAHVRALQTALAGAVAAQGARDATLLATLQSAVAGTTLTGAELTAAAQAGAQAALAELGAKLAEPDNDTQPRTS
jgi:N-acetyl-anhydromuramyl-L-alanine amidase AmpD